MIKVYGVPGWGSTISELMLTLADIPYQFVDVSGFDHEGTSRDLLKTLNPLCQVYPTFTLADYPKRWASDAPVIEYRKSLYIWLNSQLTAEPYVFGEQLTLVDCYLCTMRTWGPGHEWFQDNAPNINAIADAVCQIPKLQEVLKRNVII